MAASTGQQRERIVHDAVSGSQPYTIDMLVKKTLAQAGVYVERLRCTVESDAYIVFRLISLSDVEFADDETQANEYLYRADIFTRAGNLAQLRDTAIKALKQAGFYAISAAAEDYEKDTRYFHAPLEFYYGGYKCE